MIPHERLRTPAADGAVLIEPPIGQVAPGRPLPAWLTVLRGSLRARLGLRGPLIVTGHQCELFHAGVFAKTIAARLIAQRLGGSAAFVYVDTDAPKSQQVALPARIERRIAELRVRLPGLNLDRPIETHTDPCDEEWRRVFGALRDAQTGVMESLLPEYSSGWERGGATLAEHFAAAQRATETALGIEPLADLFMSRLAETPEFGALLAQYIGDAPAVAEHYNAAQAAYRQRHRVRNAARPVPPLERGDGRVESPFWVYRRGDERRQRLFVEPSGGAVRLFTGGGDRIAEFGRSAIEQIGASAGVLDSGPWLIRPRALTLSAFCRLVLADVFIHGIGGAKYDEVTDDFLRAWLGVEPPPLLCVSATLRLPPARGRPAPRPVSSPRDVTYNPHRALASAPPDLAQRRFDLARESDELRRAGAPRRERRRVFEAIRALNDEIGAACAPERAELRAAWSAAAEARAQAAIATNREVFYALHSRASLAALIETIRARVAGDLS